MRFTDRFRPPPQPQRGERVSSEKTGVATGDVHPPFIVDSDDVHARKKESVHEEVSLAIGHLVGEHFEHAVPGARSCKPTFDRAFFQATARRAARDRHPQALNAAGREGTTKPPDSERLRADGKKNATSRGKPGVPGTTFWARKSARSAHESLISRAMLADMPLTGLSSMLSGRLVFSKGMVVPG